MDSRRIVIPDTCTLNAMAHPVEFPDGELALAAMKAGFFVRFPLTVISEVIANKSTEDRLRVLGVCKSLLRDGDCVLPNHDILTLMVRRFEQGLPIHLSNFNLRASLAEDAIRDDMFDDSLSAQERQSNFDDQVLFDECFRAIKTENRSPMPRSFSEFVALVKTAGPFWRTAKGFYDRVAATPATDETIQEFYSACDLFRTLTLAIYAQVYSAIKPVGAPRLKAGRNDTFMATCLPLCDEFVTRDKSMLACYREVVAAAGLNVVVRSFEEFVGQFSLPSQPRIFGAPPFPRAVS